MSEDNGKQNLNESYTNKHQKHIACIYGYKLIFVDDKFSKPFKSYLGEVFVRNFISSMITENRHCTVVMKEHWTCEQRTCDDLKR